MKIKTFKVSEFFWLEYHQDFFIINKSGFMLSFIKDMKRSLSEVIKHLSSSPEVKAIFTTGTTATGLGPTSDIDLVVVLNANEHHIKSAYTMIENRFADIFFFDVAFVNKVACLKKIPANGFDGMFLAWLAKGKIEKDENGLLAKLKTKSEAALKALDISFEEKQESWFKANYNFIANQRYFKSKDDLYRIALELRLLYSVTELVVTYFTLRDLPWRGEKEAMKYFEQHDVNALQIFKDYLQSRSLAEKFRAYEFLFKTVMCGDFQKWDDHFFITKDEENLMKGEKDKYAKKLLGGDNE